MRHYLGIDEHFPINEQTIIFQPCPLLGAVAFHLEIQLVLDKKLCFYVTVSNYLPKKSSQLVSPFPGLLAQILSNVNCSSD